MLVRNHQKLIHAGLVVSSVLLSLVVSFLVLLIIAGSKLAIANIAIAEVVSLAIVFFLSVAARAIERNIYHGESRFRRSTFIWIEVLPFTLYSLLLLLFLVANAPR